MDLYGPARPETRLPQTPVLKIHRICPPLTAAAALAALRQLHDLLHHDGDIEVGIVDLVGAAEAEELGSVDIDGDVVARVGPGMGGGVVGAVDGGADQAEAEAAPMEGAESAPVDQRRELSDRRAAAGGGSEVGLDGTVALQAVGLAILGEVGAGVWIGEGGVPSGGHLMAGRKRMDLDWSFGKMEELRRKRGKLGAFSPSGTSLSEKGLGFGGFGGLTGDWGRKDGIFGFVIPVRGVGFGEGRETLRYDRLIFGLHSFVKR